MRASSKALQRTPGAPTQRPPTCNGRRSCCHPQVSPPQRTCSVGQVQNGSWVRFSSSLPCPMGLEAWVRAPICLLCGRVLRHCNRWSQAAANRRDSTRCPPHGLKASLRCYSSLALVRSSECQPPCSAAPTLFADPWRGCLKSRTSMVCVGPSGARRGRCVPFRHTWSPAVYPVCTDDCTALRERIYLREGMDS